ncbi:MAG: DnaJ domain-containing protein [Legionellaceae bacterium]|nr:DnaJ domain-containing protein [Legionellaceae bacterium]
MSMPIHTTLYEVLNVPKHATSSVIKKAYMTLALKYHPDKWSHLPDKHPEKEAAARFFTDISAAYSTLTDTDKKKKYDQSLLPFIEQYQQQLSFYHTSLSEYKNALAQQPLKFTLLQQLYENLQQQIKNLTPIQDFSKVNAASPSASIVQNNKSVLNLGECFELSFLESLQKPPSNPFEKLSAEEQARLQQQDDDSQSLLFAMYSAHLQHKLKTQSNYSAANICLCLHVFNDISLEEVHETYQNTPLVVQAAVLKNANNIHLVGKQALLSALKAPTSSISILLSDQPSLFSGAIYGQDIDVCLAALAVFSPYIHYIEKKTLLSILKERENSILHKIIKNNPIEFSKLALGQDPEVAAEAVRIHAPYMEHLANEDILLDTLAAQAKHMLIPHPLSIFSAARQKDPAFIFKIYQKYNKKILEQVNNDDLFTKIFASYKDEIAIADIPERFKSVDFSLALLQRSPENIQYITNKATVLSLLEHPSKPLKSCTLTQLSPALQNDPLFIFEFYKKYDSQALKSISASVFAQITSKHSAAIPFKDLPTHTQTLQKCLTALEKDPKNIGYISNKAVLLQILEQKSSQPYTLQQLSPDLQKDPDIIMQVNKLINAHENAQFECVFTHFKKNPQKNLAALYKVIQPLTLEKKLFRLKTIATLVKTIATLDSKQEIHPFDLYVHYVEKQAVKSPEVKLMKALEKIRAYIKKLEKLSKETATPKEKFLILSKIQILKSILTPSSSLESLHTILAHGENIAILGRRRNRWDFFHQPPKSLELMNFLEKTLEDVEKHQPPGVK